MGPFPPHRRRSELPPYSGLAKWVSVSPVPWICLCNEIQLRPKAPIQDGNQGLQMMYPTDRQETVTGTQPGYYRTKDLAIILKTLTKMFVQSKILTTNLYILQLSSQYLAQVLIPETAIRLIAEDFNNIFLDMAKNL
ncbi:hypothetical protein C2G38_2190329 [Gigaspora rosea]|uniref:Restriction of telomere capping protein 4 C-terminal domain-containing protein n=1 Tax=Gigaspora rosea TaxID=44941 RepID=A0A397V1M7_9GLOM|nr:hypothetical protein C2G38_2190329 [Gigaspora rosea]